MMCCRSFVIALFLAFSVAAPLLVVRAEEAPAHSWSASGTQSAPAIEPFNAQSSVLRMVGGLLLCFGLLGCGLHLYKRYVLPRALSDKRRMQLVERLQISQKSALVLVRLDGKEFIMTTGSESSRLVSLPNKSEEMFEQSLASACNEVGEFNA